jgi:hypothetical protein
MYTIVLGYKIIKSEGMPYKKEYCRGQQPMDLFRGDRTVALPYNLDYTKQPLIANKYLIRQPYRLQADITCDLKSEQYKKNRLSKP